MRLSAKHKRYLHFNESRFTKVSHILIFFIKFLSSVSLFNKWMLNLNPTKCEVKVFGLKRSPDPPHVLIKNVPITVFGTNPTNL